MAYKKTSVSALKKQMAKKKKVEDVTSSASKYAKTPTPSKFDKTPVAKGKFAKAGGWAKSPAKGGTPPRHVPTGETASAFRAAMRRAKFGRTK